MTVGRGPDANVAPAIVGLLHDDTGIAVCAPDLGGHLVGWRTHDVSPIIKVAHVQVS